MRHCLPIFIATLMLTVCVAANAASILVNTADDELNDDGDCSLREAVEAANTNTVVDDCNPGDAGADTITILVDGTIALTSEIEITEALTIQGLGSESTKLTGAATTRLIRINAPGDDVLLQGLALIGGRTDSYLGGAAVLIECADTIRLEKLRLAGNQAGDIGSGGAVLLNPDTDCNTRLEVTESIFSDNESAGAGGAIQIDNVPLVGHESTRVNSVLIESTLFLLNKSERSGGAISSNQVPVLTITDSRFELNQAGLDGTSNARGGALETRQLNSAAGTVLVQIERSSFLFNFADSGGAISIGGNVAGWLRNSTLFNNNHSSMTFGGAAIGASGGAALALFHSSVLNNGSGIVSDVGLASRDDATLSLNHSIVATSWTSSSYCTASDGGVIQSNGFNIDSGSSCSGHASDLVDTDPQLGTLTAYSEPGAPFDQAVLLPLDTSPAIDGGAPGDCPGPFGGLTTTDQRNRTRPVSAPTRGSDPICDIGAIEFQPDDSRIIFRDRFEAPKSR